MAYSPQAKIPVADTERLIASAIRPSRVCAVVQYALLEANPKVNGKSENLHHRPSKIPVPIWTPFEIYYYIQPGIQCAKCDMNHFSRYCSVHAWKTRFSVDFLNISLSLPGLQVILLKQFWRPITQMTCIFCGFRRMIRLLTPCLNWQDFFNIYPITSRYASVRLLLHILSSVSVGLTNHYCVLCATVLAGDTEYITKAHLSQYKTTLASPSRHYWYFTTINCT